MELYRYAHSGPDMTGSIRVKLDTYIVTKETHKGYWISSSLLPTKRWVSKTGKKRFAYPTKEQALESFYYRSKRWVMKAEQDLNKAKRVFYQAKQLQIKEPTETGGSNLNKLVKDITKTTCPLPGNECDHNGGCDTCPRKS